MKILAIGDFHGRFPAKLQRRLKKEKFDLIASLGDYANADKIRRLIFKNWANKKWYEVIGVKKAAQLERESFDSGLKVLRELNRLNKKVFIIFGNTDFYKENTQSKQEIKMPGFYDDKIKKLKNIILIDRGKKRLNDVEIIGHGGYVDVTEFIKNPIEKEKEKQKKRLKRYKKAEKILRKLFLKYKPKDFIFLTHYTPLKILDKVKQRNSPMYGKHVGFEPYNEVIKKYKPFLVICGHMHENQGKCKIEKTIVVNPGAAYEGKAAIIEVEDNRIKNVRFLR